MEFNDKQPIYLQIADYISEQILLGNWPPEERIPSVRDLASILEVNPNTVVKSYDFLQQQQVIYNKRGIGYFAAEKSIKQIRKYRRERFLERDLPEFFRNIYLLGINLEEIEERYQDFIKATYPVN
jgi:DNA-binding transcriptional regulator YhcF (GntR family)